MQNHTSCSVDKQHVEGASVVVVISGVAQIPPSKQNNLRKHLVHAINVTINHLVSLALDLECCQGRTWTSSRTTTNMHRGICLCNSTYLEKRFRIRPVGVVSKKLIGDLKMAKAIRSCNFREAYAQRV